MTEQEQAMPPKGSTYIYGIDLVRFLCAMWVTLFHLGFASWASPSFERPYVMRTIEYLAQPGWVGVELFFVISGFVVVNSAIGTSLTRFFNSRVLRLYPAVWICASLTLFVVAFDGVDSYLGRKYISSMVLFPVGPWIDGQYWTLATEICFYTLVGLLIVLGQSQKMHLLAGALTICGAASALLLLIYPDSGMLRALTQSPWKAVPISMGAHFALGIYLWLWSQGRMTFLSWLGFSVALVAGALQIHTEGIALSERTIEMAAHHYPTISPIAIWLCGLTAIAYSVARRERFAQWPYQIRKATRLLGLMTYPLYLLHFAIGIALLDILAGQGMPPMLATAIVVLFICALSLLICEWGEPPIRRALRLILERAEGGFQSGVVSLRNR